MTGRRSEGTWQRHGGVTRRRVPGGAQSILEPTGLLYPRAEVILEFAALSTPASAETECNHRLSCSRGARPGQ